MVALARSDAEAIVRAGILAPSADNKHMLEFGIGEDDIRLWATAEFLQAPFHRRILALMACGAVVENMAVEASQRGLGMDCAWSAGLNAAELATIRFLRTGAGSAEELAAAISRRHTNRRVVFRGRALSNLEREELTRGVHGRTGVQLTWLSKPPLRSQALRLLWLAESQRFRVKPLHAELFGAIRFDLGWRQSAEEGLAPGSLGIELPMRPFFTALRHWSLTRALQLIGVHWAIGFRAAYLPCRLAPELAVLSTTLDLDAGAIAVGRALEHMWLTATSMGLALQPFAAPSLLAQAGYADVPPEVRTRLCSGWSRLTPGVLPLITFRLGRAAAPDVINGRRALGEYLRPVPPLIAPS